jgi:hypothetical protein
LGHGGFIAVPDHSRAPLFNLSRYGEDQCRTSKGQIKMHNTHMAQYLPPTKLHYVTGTWTDAAGAVTSTIAKHKAANAETSVVTVPIQIPSNSVALQGSYLVSIELDYELLGAAATSVTGAVNKVARGTDTNIAVVTAQTVTQSLVAAVGAATQDQHKLVVTLSTPVWIDNDEYYLAQFSFVCGGVVTVDILAAVINFTERLN